MSSLQNKLLKLYDGQEEIVVQQPSISESLLLYNILKFKMNNSRWFHVDLRHPKKRSVSKGSSM